MRDDGPSKRGTVIKYIESTKLGQPWQLVVRSDGPAERVGAGRNGVLTCATLPPMSGLIECDGE